MKFFIKVSTMHLVIKLMFMAELFLFVSCKQESLSPNSISSIKHASLASLSSSAGYSFISSTSSVIGSVMWEKWDNIIGNDVSQIPVNARPSSTELITSIEGVVNRGANYGDRIKGYVLPPVSGNYTFWIAGDDSGELWLSTDAHLANKVKIAYMLSWTDYRQWGKHDSQRSVPIPLLAGHKYYIEVLHKQGGGGDNLSVQWMLPGGTLETPISGSRIATYTEEIAGTSDVINLNNKHNITISDKTIAGRNLAAITLTNCSNIHITKNRLLNSTDVGIHLYNCKNIIIDHNYFTNVSSGVYAEQIAEGGIVVNYNQFLNMNGPFPHGQFIQFNNVNGPNNSISYNKGVNILGQSYPEDAINLYQSSGTMESPTKIIGNWIKGGGPSRSGGGIMLGDNGGSNLYASKNILVDPGEYGMAIVGGNNNVMINNKVYARSQYFTNVGIYVNSINGYTVTNAVVSDNLVNYFNATNYNNNAWLAPGTSKPAGWDGNQWGALIDATILPDVMLSYH